MTALGGHSFFRCLILAVLPLMAQGQSSITLTGAGATFPYPVYAKWFESYRQVNPAVEIRYDAIGSEAGIRELLAGRVDFGASDDPEILHTIAAPEETKFVIVPSVIGAVVPIVNLPGFSGEVRFTPEALAGIYLGKIRKWNDPVLRDCNRDVRLPALDIVVVHRGDGSGTSYAWTTYLAKTSPEWSRQVGSGLAPSWPVGRAANGNDGVAKLVKELEGSIGYVEFIYALKNHLSAGLVKNQQGHFVSADLEAIKAAAQDAAFSGDLKSSLVDAPGKDAYPIVSLTWLIAPARMEESKRQALKSFLQWMLGPGQRGAAALGYLPLPSTVVEQTRKIVEKID